MSPRKSDESSMVQACFGSQVEFRRYQYVNLAVLAPATVLALIFGGLGWTTFFAAALMAVFDLPAVLFFGAVFLLHAAAAGHLHLADGFLWLTAGLFAGHYLAAILHNCAHGNLKPRWLNRPVGELTGFFLTYGFGTFRVVHRLHHAFTDQDLDPHSPRGLRMSQFMLGVRAQIFRQLRRSYLIAADQAPSDADRNWRHLSLVIVLNRVFRLALTVAIFGEQRFALFVLPCYLVNFLVFTIYNYKMHIDETDETVGQTTMRNLDGNWYEKLVNRTCHGVLYHRNHHLHGKFFDPRDVDGPVDAGSLRDRS